MSISGKSKICLHTQNLCCAHDKAAHILYSLLAMSIWIKQLQPCTIGCKTQIALIFYNIFNAASMSCSIIATTKILELMY